MSKTEVIFRKYKYSKGDRIIALFPYDCEYDYGSCSCYQHVGQHGIAGYADIIKETTPAGPSEYADLKKELENYGPKEANYDLKVISKINWNRYKKEYDKQIRCKRQYHF